MKISMENSCLMVLPISSAARRIRQYNAGMGMGQNTRVTNRHTTAMEGTIIHKEWGMPGATAFAGGVSDSLYGASAYELNFDSVTAKKAWFFFDKEVVCLGAGIRSKAKETVTTTVNQCWLNGSIAIPSGTVSMNNKNNL